MSKIFLRAAGVLALSVFLGPHALISAQDRKAVSEARPSATSIVSPARDDGGRILYPVECGVQDRGSIPVELEDEAISRLSSLSQCMADAWNTCVKKITAAVESIVPYPQCRGCHCSECGANSCTPIRLFLCIIR